MNELEKIRLNAADHLANAINTFITCDDRKVRRAIIFDAVDAISAHALASLVHDPDLHALRQQLFAQLITNQQPLFPDDKAPGALPGHADYLP